MLESLIRQVETCFDWVWMNGRILRFVDAKVSVASHALHYATSVFEGIRAYRVDGRLHVWMLREHITRFYQSAAEQGFVIPYTADELMQAVLNVVSLNDNGQFESLYIRPVAFIGVDPNSGKGLGVDPGEARVEVAIMTVPWGKYLTTGMFNGGATAYITSRARLLPRQAITLKQAGAYGITSVPAKLEARRHGATEGLCVNLEGDIVDGTGQTVCLVVEDVSSGQLMVLTAEPFKANILPGTTRSFFFDWLDASQMLFQWKHIPAITKQMLSMAKGMFFLGTAVEVTPITKVIWTEDGRLVECIIGDGQIHSLVAEAMAFYQEAVHGRIGSCQQYLTSTQPRHEAIGRMIAHGVLS